MDFEEAKNVIRTGIRVTRQQVTIAKAVVLGQLVGGKPLEEAEFLLGKVIQNAGITIPTKLFLRAWPDLDAAIKTVADGYSWKLAGVEAISSLVGGGYLICTGGVSSVTPRVDWTTVPPGGGSGMSGGLEIPDLCFYVPNKIQRAPSLLGPTGEYLTDPDLFLRTLNLSAAHDDVEMAIREAARCFRAELYLATVAMLGKASESSWITLGDALLTCAAAHATTFSKQRAILDDTMAGPGKKVESVLKIYDRQDIFKPLADSSGIRLQELRLASIWSETVRDARNTLHHLVLPATPNTYEKVAVLMLGAAQPLREIHTLKAAAQGTTV
jgi:hypothetical protein